MRCHSLNSGRASGIIFKIDFEKAFDSVNWDFLASVLVAYGFGNRFVSWIMQYYKETRTSILVNGSPTFEFSPSCGLRQGDPISPLLFNLVAEVLSFMINKAVSDGDLKGSDLDGVANTITHVQFADDTLIFIRDEIESLVAIKKIL